MNISLTPELEKLVQDKVASGMYHSASEVIREGLRLVIERDELHQKRLEQLNRDISVGLDEASMGKTVDADNAYTRLKARGASRRK